MNHPLTIWLGALITLTVLSYLVKDNVFYRVAQRAAMGVTVGVGSVITWQQVLYPYWGSHIQGAFRGTEPWTGALWLLVLIPGSLWYFQMSKRWFWLSRLVVGMFVGVAAGLAFKGQVLLILPQIGAALKPLNPWGPEGLTAASVFACLNNAVFMIAFFTTLLYFCFTLKTENRAFRVPMQTGRLAIMIALGAMFGNTVMTRMAFLIERIQFLYQVWLAPLFGG
jgi:hypothetical protein